VESRSDQNEMGSPRADCAWDDPSVAAGPLKLRLFRTVNRRNWSLLAPGVIRARSLVLIVHPFGRAFRAGARNPLCPPSYSWFVCEDKASKFGLTQRHNLPVAHAPKSGGKLPDLVGNVRRREMRIMPFAHSCIAVSQ